MGSYCSQLGSPNKASHLPPEDLSTLLNNYEQELPDSKYWLDNFKDTLAKNDHKTEQVWRVCLLDFVLVAREGLNQGIADNEHILNALQEHLDEGGIAVSDYSLRQALADDIEALIKQSHGAKGTRAVISGKKASSAGLLERLQQVLLDPSVWRTLENEYTKYLRLKPAPPPLAVILSIL